jgi:outer membrane protein assembly factor BamE (lipoprotein component of BamABCDE complex)
MKKLYFLPLLLVLGGCMTAAQHSQQLGSTQDRALTLGLVQKQIKVGISQTDVASILGSPNIVTGDNQNHETWIYDKVATEASFSEDNGNVAANVTANSLFVPYRNTSINTAGSLAGGYSKSAGATSLTQRTLTVIIKFSSANTVESVSYNSTRF